MYDGSGMMIRLGDADDERRVCRCAAGARVCVRRENEMMMVEEREREASERAGVRTKSEAEGERAQEERVDRRVGSQEEHEGNLSGSSSSGTGSATATAVFSLSLAVDALTLHHPALVAHSRICSPSSSPRSLVFFSHWLLFHAFCLKETDSCHAQG